MTVQIGYESLEDRSGVTVSSPDASVTNPALNAVDRLEFDYWQNDAVQAAPELLFTASGTQACDYIAIYAHDLAVATDEYRLQHSPDNATWVTDIDWTTASDGVIFKSFTSATDLYWRVVFRRDGGSATPFAPIIGVLSVGTMFDVTKGAQIGFKPPLSLGYKPSASTSIDGTFIGRSIRDMAVPMDLRFKLLTPAFVRSDWMPFFEHAKTMPFFVSWNETTYPEEGAFCWVDKHSDMRPPSYTSSAIMTATVKVMAKV